MIRRCHLTRSRLTESVDGRSGPLDLMRGIRAFGDKRAVGKLPRYLPLSASATVIRIRCTRKNRASGLDRHPFARPEV